MRISDWSSDVCSSDLIEEAARTAGAPPLRVAFDVNLPMIRPALIFSAVLVFFAGVELFGQIGRASCRERVCQYVSISVVAVSFKKKKYNRSTICIESRTQLRNIRKKP